MSGKGIRADRMDSTSPFILLDDAREDDASDARIYENPQAIFVARHADEVARILQEAEAARKETGAHLVGYLAYEAGLALEGRLTPLADQRSGSNGPLVWLGLFENEQVISSDKVPDWLSERANSGGASNGTPIAASIGPMEPQISTGEYLTQFDRLQEAIRAGDIYQANYTMMLAGPAQGDPVALYAAIRPAAKAGYGGIIFDGTHWLLSFSPELFFTLNGREAKVKPMKGTRPRGRNPAEDKALADELSSSIKDKSENLMIVDLMRNDLSRVSEAGSVRVDNLFAIESYPTVHQMVSTVRGALKPGLGAMDVLGALFPCGSITGAPKIRAMELINEVERDARGPYCGAIGRIAPNGDAAFNVAIRTIRLTPGENQRHHAVLGVGGANVADSEGMSEWRECLVKGGFVRGDAGGFDLIESMAVDPETGIAHLEMHLERIKASAAELGFPFDRHEARNLIQALCFELEEPAKLRLLASRQGELALETSPMSKGALPEPVRCAALPLPVDPSDWRLRHKTTDRAFYESAHKVAAQNGADEALLIRDDGLLTEASRSNIFIERDGKLLTPVAALGLLPGVLRRSLLEEGRAIEAELTLEDLADGFFLGNSVRGLMKAVLV